MKSNNSRLVMLLGWLALLGAMGLFCLQAGYFLIHHRYQVEYVDNRLFYFINILAVILLLISLLLFLRLSGKVRGLIIGIVVVFIIVNVALMQLSQQHIQNIISLSPNLENTLVIKQDQEQREAIYYRTQYYLFARPHQRLPKQAESQYKIDWLTEDVVAVTYQTMTDSIEQFVGTYGDRGDGISYYEVGVQIQGEWAGEETHVNVGSEGIQIDYQQQSEWFEWNDVVQFGTLAIVLSNQDGPAWTIVLNEGYQIYDAENNPPEGEITLYQVTMEEHPPIILKR
ncbi:hypothetical protein [Amphibacillus cookii]|uniref:hypothetical protein n=1 Tax=Amphibacillus cookii TaxID=767787 RepID=UPI00195E7B81|nr:hypothetical protein [Amphibacillus cookii]MBM7541964.1 hypothetical protein [Amphibacillus cookii]